VWLSSEGARGGCSKKEGVIKNEAWGGVLMGSVKAQDARIAEVGEPFSVFFCINTFLFGGRYPHEAGSMWTVSAACSQIRKGAMRVNQGNEPGLHLARQT
jgi:hypothetical protein